VIPNFHPTKTWNSYTNISSKPAFKSEKNWPFYSNLKWHIYLLATRTNAYKTWSILCLVKVPDSGVSSIFLSGGQLILTGQGKTIWTQLLYEKLSARWSDPLGKIILTAGQFTWFPAFNENPDITVNKPLQGRVEMASFIHIMRKWHHM